MHGRRTPSPSLLLAILSLTGPALASQALAEPPASPAPAKPAAAPPKSAPPAPSRRIKPTPASPAAPAAKTNAIPGLEDADLSVPAATLRAEGAFLTSARCGLVRLKSGEIVLVFHADDKGRRERPMVALPSRTLEALEAAWQNRGENSAYLVSGQIFVYEGVNYLLPTAFGLVDDPAPSQPAPAQPAKPDTASSTPADPDVTELMRALEKQRDRPRALDRASRVSPQQSKLPAAGELAEEGSRILRRRGRLVRVGSDWTFVFDSGPSGQTDLDHPLVMLPSLTLQRMEAWVGTRGDAATFTVTGVVYTYKGRNHLMPTAFTVNRDADLNSRQSPMGAVR